MPESLMRGAITIATSIMPRRIEAQQVAVTSWLRIGFDVVSINIGDEVAHLQQLFPGVRFETVESGIANPPHVPLREVFARLSGSTSPVCGIVNSDVSLLSAPDLLLFLASEAAESIVFGPRMDVSPCGQSVACENSLGFDFFFFNREMLEHFPHGDFELGMPWWDFWFPLVAASRGAQLKRLITPIAYHVVHEIGWSEDDLDRYWRILSDALFAESRVEDVSRPELPVFARAFQYERERGAEILRNYLQYATGCILIPDPDMHPDVVSVNGKALLDMRNKLVNYEERLAEMERSLAAVRSSNSWRLTEPLRNLKSKAIALIR